MQASFTRLAPRTQGTGHGCWRPASWVQIQPCDPGECDFPTLSLRLLVCKMGLVPYGTTHRLDLRQAGM